MAEAEDGGRVEVRDPHEGSLLAEVAAAGEDDVDRAVDAARSAFTHWAGLAAAERGLLLLRPLSTLRLAELIADVGFPPAWSMVPGYGQRAGRRLAAHPGVDKVTFTGSAPAPWRRVHLELGGKGANLVFDDAGLEDAVQGSVFGRASCWTRRSPMGSSGRSWGRPAAFGWAT